MPLNKNTKSYELYVARGWVLLSNAITKAHCLALRNRAADSSGSFASPTVSAVVKKRLHETGIWDPAIHNIQQLVVANRDLDQPRSAYPFSFGCGREDNKRPAALCMLLAIKAETKIAVPSSNGVTHIITIGVGDVLVHHGGLVYNDVRGGGAYLFAHIGDKPNQASVPRKRTRYSWV